VLSCHSSPALGGSLRFQYPYSRNSATKKSYFLNDKDAAKVRVKEIVLRIIVGGVVVSVFSMMGDLLKPKSFAGLFGAAPSVALATIALTVMKDGRAYASTEAKSMILGSVAFFVYACVVSRLLMRRRMQVLAATSACILLWLGCAFGLWFVAVR
jgi:Protein of unknown function (DUF3147)